MSDITTLLRDLLQGRNFTELARETGINRITLWRISTGKQFADLRTGDAEKVFLAVTGRPLIGKGAGK